MARYREPDADQSQMVVLNFSELFPEEHPVPRLLSTIRQLDFGAFDDAYQNDAGQGGRPAVPPDRMVALIVYSLLHGNVSMRNLERDLHQRADLMFLSGGLLVDHSTLAKFRLRHAAAIQELFTQTVFLGIQTGMIDLDTVCIDGTRIKASANRQDIGTRETLEKRYAHVKESCAKRYAEWQKSDDEEHKQNLRRQTRRLKREQERLAAGMQFLREHANKKRVHLTDPDADWQHDGNKKFIVGYNAQAAVDAKSRMIVHQDVSTEQSDSSSTIPMVNAVEEIRRASEITKTKYVLDSGYSSKRHLHELRKLDLYMPDHHFAHEINGGKTRPEDRKRNRRKPPRVFDVKPGTEPVFEYQQESDSFTCPAGGSLEHKRERELQGVPYRLYQKYGCTGCPIQDTCAGPGRKRKDIWIKRSDSGKPMTRRHAFRGDPNPKAGSKGNYSDSLLVEMRKKLSTPEGRAVYSRRFPVSEGVFGTLKATRNAGRFLTRGLDRVRIEWATHALAHNLARVIGFTRNVAVVH